jgi:hypothetical protein
MKKIILIVLAMLIAYSVYYAFNKNLVKFSTPTPTEVNKEKVIPTNPTTLIPTIAKENIIEEIKKGFATKYKKPNNSFVLSISMYDATHAKGSISFKDEMGGGLWFGAKVDEAWKLVWDGNGIIDCEIVNKYDFPVDMIPGCVDTKNGDKFIQR